MYIKNERLKYVFIIINFIMNVAKSEARLAAEKELVYS